MDINEAIQAVDHAAHQDDRWMFVALTKSSEVIAHNSAIIEQIQRKLAG